MSTLADRARLHVLPRPSEIDRFRRFTELALERGQGIVGLDVETTEITQSKAFDPASKLRMVQFGGRATAWCLDPADPAWHEAIAQTLADERLRFVSHTNYDVLWCDREFGVNLAETERSLDTYVIACLLWPGEVDFGGGEKKHSLKYQTRQHIDDGLVAAEEALHARFAELAPKVAINRTTKDGSAVMTKMTGKALSAWGFTNIPITDPAFTLYGGLDAVYVRVLLDRYRALLNARTLALRRLSVREQHIQRLGTGVQRRGLLLDRDRTHEVLGEIEGEFENAIARLEIMFGFAARSPRRAQWLKERGVVNKARTPSGAWKLDRDVVEALAERYETDSTVGPVLADMLTISTGSNLVTNLRKILDSADPAGFVHPSVNTQQAVTGRMSITAPPMQTFKKDDKRLRGCFIARPGHVLISADYASQELKLAYAFSRDRTIGLVLRDGLSQHVVTARSIFGSAFKGKDESPVQYRAAKVLNFAQQYGAGPKRIGEQLGLRYDDARDLWLQWRQTYAGLVEWSEKMSERRVVVNPWGREIPRDKLRPYANGNYMIQSSGRELLGDAMVSFARAGHGEWIWLPIHDEIVVEVPEDQADYASKVLEECMFATVHGVEMIAETEIFGTRWGGEKRLSPTA